MTPGSDDDRDARSDRGYLVGAYPAEPSDQEQRSEVARVLGRSSLVGGLELPFSAESVEREVEFAARIAPGWRIMLSSLAGTSAALKQDPSFGLASVSPRGRGAALEFVDDLRRFALRLQDRLGRAAVSVVELHSAPRRGPDGAESGAEQLAESLREICEWDWSGARLAVEHCDAYREGQVPAKGFLTLDEELDVLRADPLRRVGIILNWGRSAIEERDVAAVVRHVTSAREAGVLQGIVFSGCSNRVSDYGKPWADAHLPPAPSRAGEPGETASLMTVRHMRDCVAAAGPLDVLGVKVSLQPPTQQADVVAAHLLAAVHAVDDAVRWCRGS